MKPLKIEYFKNERCTGKSGYWVDTLSGEYDEIPTINYILVVGQLPIVSTESLDDESYFYIVEFDNETLNQ